MIRRLFHVRMLSLKMCGFAFVSDDVFVGVLGFTWVFLLPGRFSARLLFSLLIDLEAVLLRRTLSILLKYVSCRRVNSKQEITILKTYPNKRQSHCRYTFAPLRFQAYTNEEAHARAGGSGFLSVTCTSIDPGVSSFLSFITLFVFYWFVYQCIWKHCWNIKF